MTINGSKCNFYVFAGYQGSFQGSSAFSGAQTPTSFSFKNNPIINDEVAMGLALGFTAFLFVTSLGALYLKEKKAAFIAIFVFSFIAGVSICSAEADIDKNTNFSSGSSLTDGSAFNFVYQREASYYIASIVALLYFVIFILNGFALHTYSKVNKPMGGLIWRTRTAEPTTQVPIAHVPEAVV